MGGDKYQGNDTAESARDEQLALQYTRRALGEVRSNAEDILSRIRWPMWWPWAPLEPSTEEPTTDIVDTDAEFKVMIDLPGTAKEDIDVSATRDRVEITAANTEMPARQNVKYITRERRCATFRRVLALSEQIIPEETEASVEDGVLTIILKKKPTEAERVKVKIK